MNKASVRAISPSVLRYYRETSLGIHLTIEHKMLVYYGECAQAGLLLRNILQVNSKTDKPLDRILRLYIANEIDQILMRTGVLNGMPADVFLDMDTNNGLLKWYCENTNLLSSENRINKYIEYLEQWEDLLTKPRKIQKGDSTNKALFSENHKDSKADAKDSHKVSFSSLYKDLDQNYQLTMIDADKILDFYLNETRIREKWDVRHIALKYLNRLISYLTGKGKRYQKELRGEDYVYLRNIIQACGYERQVTEFQELLESLLEEDMGE